MIDIQIVSLVFTTILLLTVFVLRYKVDTLRNDVQLYKAKATVAREQADELLEVSKELIAIVDQYDKLPYRAKNIVNTGRP